MTVRKEMETLSEMSASEKNTPQQNIKDSCLHAYYPLCIVRVVNETA